MATKKKSYYVCNSCGQDYHKWVGKCENCGAWDTISEVRGVDPRKSISPAANINSQAKPIPLTECGQRSTPRIVSPYNEVDRVLGGGLVAGAFILLGGDPGIGKSTLLLQMVAQWAKGGKKVLYISGEESAEQVSMRASRLDLQNAPIQLLTETAIESIVSAIVEIQAEIVVVDSIQTMFTEQLESAPGSVSQIRECAAMLLRLAKANNTTIIVIGHVTKDGTIAGPRVLEHMVDTVLQFEGDSSYNYRILRAIKNRFGPSNEIALFTMADRGLQEVANASEFFLLSRQHPQVGTSVTAILEGTRILVVELQALVNRSHFGLPQRVASGINPKKLSLLLAVLERHSGIVLGDHDVFFNIAGGLTVAEPSIDLAVSASIVSSFRNKPIRSDIGFLGELGLGGEVRPVNNMLMRLKELYRLGFKECVVPVPGPKADWRKIEFPLTLTCCINIQKLQDLIF